MRISGPQARAADVLYICYKLFPTLQKIGLGAIRGRQYCTSTCLPKRLHFHRPQDKSLFPPIQSLYPDGIPYACPSVFLLPRCSSSHAAMCGFSSSGRGFWKIVSWSAFSKSRRVLTLCEDLVLVSWVHMRDILCQYYRIADVAHPTPDWLSNFRCSDNNYHPQAWWRTRVGPHKRTSAWNSLRRNFFATDPSCRLLTEAFSGLMSLLSYTDQSYSTPKSPSCFSIVGSSYPIEGVHSTGCFGSLLAFYLASILQRLWSRYGHAAQERRSGTPLSQGAVSASPAF